MKKFFFAMVLCAMSQASLVEVKTEQEFQMLVNNSSAPVMVQMSAYWCGPCQSLKTTLKKVAEDYTDAQIRIVYADAYVMKSLAKYLQGGYPTMRVFENGQVTSKSFTGSQSESFVRNFIDSVKKTEAEFPAGATCPAPIR